MRKLAEWLFRSATIRDARAGLRADGARERAANQARLLVEVARLVATSADALAPGSRAGAMLVLYRDAVYWALVAATRDDSLPASDLAALWAASDRTSPAKTANAALDGVMEEVVLPFSQAAAIEATTEQAFRARAFTERVVAELEAPRRRYHRLIRQRWLRVAGVVAVVALLGLGFRGLALGPNLAAGKPFRTSSTYGGCPDDPACHGLMFHTNTESSPWVEIDLGSARPVHRVEVANRGDCCAERAAPLVVEVSNDDRATWTEVARRETEFATWVARFPSTVARYVRLRVARDSALHLEGVRIR